VSPRHNDRVVPARVKGGHRGYVVEEYLHGDPSLESGQASPRAHVRTSPESEMAARIGTIDSKSPSVFEV